MKMKLKQPTKFLALAWQPVRELEQACVNSFQTDVMLVEQIRVYCCVLMNRSGAAVVEQSFVVGDAAAVVADVVKLSWLIFAVMH